MVAPNLIINHLPVSMTTFIIPKTLSCKLLSCILALLLCLIFFFASINCRFKLTSSQFIAHLNISWPKNGVMFWYTHAPIWLIFIWICIFIIITSRRVGGASGRCRVEALCWKTKESCNTEESVLVFMPAKMKQRYLSKREVIGARIWSQFLDSIPRDVRHRWQSDAIPWISCRGWKTACIMSLTIMAKPPPLLPSSRSLLESTHPAI